MHDHDLQVTIPLCWEREQAGWLVPLHQSIRDEAQFNEYDWMGAPVTKALSDKSELQGMVPVQFCSDGLPNERSMIRKYRDTLNAETHNQ